MFDWFWQALGLDSPREIRRHREQFRREMRACELQLARALAEEGLTGEYREQALVRVAEAEQKFAQEGA